MNPTATTATVQLGEVEIAYEEIGDPTGEPLLLIMGLGLQMIGWDDELCAMLADRGFYVIRYDNRDVGLSSRVAGPAPGLGAISAALAVGRRPRGATYLLRDMAGDAAGLLDALEIPSANVAGASMGAMIAQSLAASHPNRVRSLTSIMAGSGKRGIRSLPGLRAWRAMALPAPRTREQEADRMARAFELIGSPGYPRDPERVRRLIGESADRVCGLPPESPGRHWMAILGSGDRTEELRRITAPTLVVHGSDDPLVRPAAGRAVAETIPNASYVEIEGMGHDLPPGLYPKLTDLIASNADRPALMSDTH